jgi:hypothetical protein
MEMGAKEGRVFYAPPLHIDRRSTKGEKEAEGDSPYL